MRPFRSTATGDLYRIADTADLERVQLVGYGRRSLALRVARRDLAHGLLAISLAGRPVRLRFVAAARSTALRARHGLLLTRGRRARRGSATASGGTSRHRPPRTGRPTATSAGPTTTGNRPPTTTTTTTTPTTTTTTPTPTPPRVSITSGPAAGSTQHTATATFAFSADQSGATFECSLDGATLTRCSSPTSHSGLANGSHTFTVEASVGGLASAPVSVKWTVSVQSSNNCPIPYSSASPWNMPISSGATVDPNSTAEIATLTTNTSYPELGSDPTQYTMPVYTVNSSTPTIGVFVSDSWSNVTDPTTLHRSYGGNEIQVPVPTGAQSANGGDSQVIVWNPTTGDEWGFYQFIDASDALTANLPAGAGTSGNPLPVQNAYADYWVGQQIVIGRGTPRAETATIASFPDSTHMVLVAPTTSAHSSGDVVSGVGATNGYHYNTLWSGVPPAGFASRGAGVPYLTGLVRPCEIAQGHIDHALAFGYQNTTSQFVYPATKSDGGASVGLPEGAHLQLDPSISDSTIQSWGCTGACFIAAKAMQKYGMYLIDTAGHPKVYFEYDGTANWGGAVSASTMNPIPLSDFRVVDG